VSVPLPVVQVIGDTDLRGSLEPLVPNPILNMEKLFVCLIFEMFSLMYVDGSLRSPIKALMRTVHL
jgi:hypothetical protein